ncbi:hypothetical protein EVAR_82316_1 [Eumeta japonica]|uniref:Uncharacterized protein n=1 Tax=Eumeta variegata TaxID=151549 RepID=A0A4C1UB58_EUMVA|nr:hypothetical protein EVAR_82316_1 [Eumeta japonica]
MVSSPIFPDNDVCATLVGFSLRSNCCYAGKRSHGRPLALAHVTTRWLNNYLINTNIAFHSHPLEKERKVKAVIRGISDEFSTDELMTDLAYRGYTFHSPTEDGVTFR